jgi:hypothetical protein
MSASTGSIQVRVTRRPIGVLWLTALLLAGLLAIAGIWALIARDEGSTPPVQAPQVVPVEHVDVPAGWRRAPTGELIPRPFAPIEPGSG